MRNSISIDIDLVDVDVHVDAEDWLPLSIVKFLFAFLYFQLPLLCLLVLGKEYVICVFSCSHLCGVVWCGALYIRHTALLHCFAC